MKFTQNREVPIVLGCTPAHIDELYRLADSVPRLDADEARMVRLMYVRHGAIALTGMLEGWEVPPRLQLAQIRNTIRQYLPERVYIGPYFGEDTQVLPGIRVYDLPGPEVVSRQLTGVNPADTVYLTQKRISDGNIERFSRRTAA